MISRERAHRDIEAEGFERGYRAGVEVSRETTRMILMDDDYNCWMCEECHNDWEIMEGSPSENNMNYCTSCGRRIVGEVIDKEAEGDV